MQENLFFVLVTERWVGGFENSCAISTSGSITRRSEREAAVFVIPFRNFKNIQTIAPGVIRR